MTVGPICETPDLFIHSYVTTESGNASEKENGEKWREGGKILKVSRKEIRMKRKKRVIGKGRAIEIKKNHELRIFPFYFFFDLLKLVKLYEHLLFLEREAHLT